MTTGNWVPLVLPLLGLPLVISSFWWMSAPTVAGRGVLDRIDSLLFPVVLVYYYLTLPG